MSAKAPTPRPPGTAKPTPPPGPPIRPVGPSVFEILRACGLESAHVEDVPLYAFKVEFPPGVHLSAKCVPGRLPTMTVTVEDIDEETARAIALAVFERRIPSLRIARIFERASEAFRRFGRAAARWKR